MEDSDPVMSQLAGVQFRYPGKAPLFSDLEYTINPGGVVGLLGRNGAGKTSLLKLVAGVLFPTGGSARLFGYPTTARKAAALARVVFIPEQFEVSAVRLKDFIDIQRGYYPRFDEQVAERILQRFEVSGNDSLGELSYGQQKKVLIATALASGAELVILDEPTNGLDIPAKQVFRRVVAESVDEHRTVIISTHQVRDVANLIDPVVVLEGGRIVLDRPMAEIVAALNMRRFPSEVAAEQAGALAVESQLGNAIALMPRSAVGGEDMGDAIDLELLFQGAISRGTELHALCGGDL
jgi:ABC-2 type transport system ATP-binding protein